MSFISSSRHVALIMVSLALFSVNANCAKFPTNWLGHWHGVPEYTSTGPKLDSSSGISFTVAAIDDTHWYMEDNVGLSTNLFHSQQQFFMQTYENGTEDNFGIIEYCGWLAGYYLNMPHHGPVCNMIITRMSDTAMTFKYNMSMQNTATLYMPWNVEWWWNLIDENTMTSFIQVPAGPEYAINHLLVNLTRISTDPIPHLSEEGRAIVANKVTKSVCNFTKWPIPLPPQSKDSANDVMLDGGKSDPRLVCPHGFTKNSAGASGMMPQFVKDRIKARRTMGLPTLGHDDDDDDEDVKPVEAALHRSGVPTPPQFLDSHTSESYQYCVRLNSYHNFTIEYTYNTVAKAVDVHLSARPITATASASYIALGIMPAWPSMLGMDIILGYIPQQASSGKNVTQPCVRSMYAAHNAGTPVDNPSQTITAVSVSTSDNDKVIHMQFSRPWTTGNWDLSQGPVFNQSYLFIPIPIVAWAIGEAPATCTADPVYHHSARGTHGFDWPDPKSAIIPQAFCDGKWPEQDHE